MEKIVRMKLWKQLMKYDIIKCGKVAYSTGSIYFLGNCFVIYIQENERLF